MLAHTSARMPATDRHQSGYLNSTNVLGSCLMVYSSSSYHICYPFLNLISCCQPDLSMLELYLYRPLACLWTTSLPTPFAWALLTLAWILTTILSALYPEPVISSVLIHPSACQLPTVFLTVICQPVISVALSSLHLDTHRRLFSFCHCKNCQALSSCSSCYLTRGKKCLPIHIRLHHQVGGKCFSYFVSILIWLNVFIAWHEVITSHSLCSRCFPYIIHFRKKKCFSLYKL